MQETELTDWLLGAQTPSIRYLTLRQLLDRAESDPTVQAARQAMQASGPIPVILAEQSANGTWSGEHSYYTPKYFSTHWSMLLLAELDADHADPRLERGAASVLDRTRAGLQRHLEQGDHGLTCFWANVLRYSLHAGLAQDIRLSYVIQTLVHDGLQAEWRCLHNDEWPCAWGAGRALWALAALPAHLHSPDTQAAIRSAVTYLLEDNHLCPSEYPLPERAKTNALWSRFNFPLFYQADVLLVLRALAEMRLLDHPGAAPALDWLDRRREKNGRWRGSSPYRSRTWKALGDRHETDRWVSLQIATVLASR